MFLSGFVRPSVWMAMYRASQKGVSGNMKGEGRLLGGKGGDGIRKILLHCCCNILIVMLIMLFY